MTLPRLTRRHTIILSLIAALTALVVITQLPSRDERALIGYWRIQDADGKYTRDVHFASRRLVRMRTGDEPYEQYSATWWITGGELRLRDRLSATDWLEALLNNDRDYLNGYSQGRLVFVSKEEFQLHDVDEATQASVTFKRITATAPPMKRVEESVNE